jgi:hypothetical protein
MNSELRMSDLDQRIAAIDIRVAEILEKRRTHSLDATAAVASASPAEGLPVVRQLQGDRHEDDESEHDQREAHQKASCRG